jgi:predicted lysophospholipase L1 biosynthesis ABC-type transport system permease subunit
VNATVEGRPTVVGSVAALKGSLGPTLVSGRLPRGPGEIVLGPKLLDAIGASIGDRVDVDGGSRTKLRVVGTALNIDPQDQGFGTTAFVAPEILGSLRGETGLFNEETALRFRPHADVVAATDRLKAAIPLGLTDESFPGRPAAVGNVAELGRLPQMIAFVLGVIGAIAVAHAVVVATRRRRHELAVLAALGMTRAQRARIVVSMAATMIGLGVLVGVPLGVLLGSYVWSLMAQGLRVDWSAIVPGVEVLGIAAAAVSLALLVALVPARSAFRVRPSAELRSG